MTRSFPKLLIIGCFLFVATTVVAQTVCDEFGSCSTATPENTSAVGTLTDQQAEEEGKSSSISCPKGEIPFQSTQDHNEELSRAQRLGDYSCFWFRKELTEKGGKGTSNGDQALQDTSAPPVTTPTPPTTPGNEDVTCDELSGCVKNTGNTSNGNGGPSDADIGIGDGDGDADEGAAPANKGGAPAAQYNCGPTDDGCLDQFINNNFSELKDGDRFRAPTNDSVDTPPGRLFDNEEGGLISEFVQCTGDDCNDPAVQSKLQAHNAGVANQYFASGAGLAEAMEEGNRTVTEGLLPSTRELTSDVIGATDEWTDDDTAIFNARGRVADEDEFRVRFENERDREIVKTLAAKEGIKPDDITLSELSRYRKAVTPLTKNISGATRKHESPVTVNGLTVPEHVQLAVAEYNLKHGTNYKAHVFSEMGPHGSMRHRQPGDLRKGRQGGCACAADMYIYDGNGRALTHSSKDQVVASEIGKIYARNTGGTANFGTYFPKVNGVRVAKRYMVGGKGEMGIHFDVANLHYKRGGYSTGWNAIARDSGVKTAVSNMSVGKTFSRTSNGVRFVSEYTVSDRKTGAPTTLSPATSPSARIATPSSATPSSNVLTAGNSGSLRIPTTGIRTIDTAAKSLNQVFDNALTSVGGSALPTNVLSNLASGSGNILSSLFSMFTGGGGGGSGSSPSTSGSSPVLRPAVPILSSSPSASNSNLQSRATAAGNLYNLLRQQGQELDQLDRNTGGIPSFSQLRNQISKQNDELRRFASQNPAADQNFIQQMIRENEAEINDLQRYETSAAQDTVTEAELQSQIGQLTDTIDALQRQLDSSTESAHDDVNGSSNLTVTALKATKAGGDEYRFRGSIRRTITDGSNSGNINTYFGNNVVHELVVDYGCDGSVDTGVVFATPYYSILPRTDGAEVLLSEYLKIPRDGLHCFAFSVDIDDVIDETNERDNTSEWREFIAGFGASTEDSTSLPPLNFEVAVYTENYGGITQNWTDQDVVISADQELAFRWDAPEYRECVPLVSSMTAGSAANTDPVDRNTRTENIEIHEHTGYYELRCVRDGAARVESVHVVVSSLE